MANEVTSSQLNPLLTTGGAQYPSQRTPRQSRLFIVLLVGGAISIIAGRTFPGTFLVLGILFPVLLIVSYAISCSRTEFAGTTRQEAADNSYYLGFLYFLVSLCIALITFDASRPNVASIIESFGTGLVTSICGLAARIVLMQGGAQLVSTPQEAEQELFRAVERFKASLHSSSDLLRNASRAISGQLSEHHNQVAASSATAAQKLGETLTHAVGMLELRLASIEVPAQLLTERLSPLLEGLARDVTALADHVRAVDTAVRQSSESIGGAVERLASMEVALSESMSRSTAALQGVPGAASALEAAHKLLSDIGHSVAESAKVVASATASVEQFGVRMSSVLQSDRAKELDQALSVATKSLESYRKASSDGASSLVSVDSAARGAADELRALGQAVGPASKQAAVLLDAHTRLTSDIAGAVDSFRGVVAAFSSLIQSQSKQTAGLDDLIQRMEELARRTDALHSSVGQLSARHSGFRSFFGR